MTVRMDPAGLAPGDRIVIDEDLCAGDGLLRYVSGVEPVPQGVAVRYRIVGPEVRQPQGVDGYAVYAAGETIAVADSGPLRCSDCGRSHRRTGAPTLEDPDFGGDGSGVLLRFPTDLGAIFTEGAGNEGLDLCEDCLEDKALEAGVHEVEERACSCGATTNPFCPVHGASDAENGARPMDYPS